MKILIIIPTYNEQGNIAILISEIWAQTAGHDISILIVDSHSPDGTGETVEGMARSDARIHVLHQPLKLGLGKAYLEGFHWAFQRDFELIVTMDADLSHDPAYIPEMIRQAANYDLVIGSRYVRGGGAINWSLSRKMISGFGNWYAKTIVGIPLNDLTSGFHCFHRQLLQGLLEPEPQSEGYVFLIELKFRSVIKKARVLEIPIIFRDRLRGKSKISKRIIGEAAVRVWQFAAKRFDGF